MMDFCLTPLGRSIVEANRGLVGMVLAGSAAGSSLPREDREQIGYLGLMRAVVGFDETRGFELSTYASHCILNALRRAEYGGDVIHVPHHVRGAKAAAKPHLAGYAERARRVTSLSVMTGHDRQIDPPAREEEDAAEYLEHRDRRLAELERAIEALPPRCRRVIKLRLRGKTLETIGREMERPVCKEWIRQIEAQAHELLRLRLAECA